MFSFLILAMFGWFVPEILVIDCHLLQALCVALSLGARLSSPPNNPTPEQQNDELDEFEAYAMESLGGKDRSESLTSNAILCD